MYDFLKTKTTIRLFAGLVIICCSRTVLDASQLQSQRTNPKSEAISSILREVISKERIPGIIAAITSSEGIVAIGSEGVRRINTCLLYTSPSPRDRTRSRMPSSA